MNKLICTLFAAALSISAYSATAATTNPDNGSNIANEDSPQQMEQSRSATSKTGKRGMHRKAMMHDCKGNMKDMDSNADGKVSKQEFMTFHEQKFDAMKQTDGMVDMKDMGPGMYKGGNNSSMNNKPIGTTAGKSTNGSTDDTKTDEPINGTRTGTNK